MRLSSSPSSIYSGAAPCASLAWTRTPGHSLSSRISCAAALRHIGGVCTLDEGLTVDQRSACDVIVASVTLPHDGAVEFTQTVVKHHPAVKVLLTGLVASNTLMMCYLEHGVAGYIHTEDSWLALVQKMHAASRREGLISPALTTALSVRLRELKPRVSERHGLQTMNPTTLYASLTEREKEGLTLLEQGYSNLAIGAALCSEAGTVKNHVHNLLDKLGVPTRSHAASLARPALASR